MEKVVNIKGTVDMKVIVIVILTFTVLMMITGYNLSKTEIQDAIVSIQESNAKIAKYKSGITLEEVNIKEQNKILKKYKIQFNQ